MYISVGDDKRVDVYVNMMVVSLYDLSEVGMVSLNITHVFLRRAISLKGIGDKVKLSNCEF